MRKHFFIIALAAMSVMVSSCGPQIYYDSRVSHYQQVMKDCPRGQEYICQEKYDRMLLTYEQSSAFASPFVKPEEETDEFAEF